MFELFTAHTQRVITLASEEARGLNHSRYCTEHLLLGLIRDGESNAAKALASHAVSYSVVRDKVETLVYRGQNQASRRSLYSVQYSTSLKRTLDLSHREMLQLGHSYIEPEHLLLGLLRFGEGNGISILRALGVDLRLLHQSVIMEMTGYRKQAAAPSDQTTHFDHRLALIDASKNASPAQLAAALRTLSATNDELEQLQGVFGGE